MKHKKIWLSACILLLSLFTSMAAVPAFAEAIPESELRWKSCQTEDGKKGVAITGCTSEEAVWEFPSEIGGESVLRIEQLHPNDPTYFNTTTKEIVIPEGVVEIDYAFAGYSALEKVTLPQSLKSIGLGCFTGCSSLKEINLPNGLESIGYEAFSYCKSLERMVIPDSVTELGTDVFLFCESLKDVTLSAGLKEIPDNTFYMCKSLNSIVIPEGIERIGESVFDSDLKTVTLPESLTYVDNSGLKCGSLEKIVYNGTKAEFFQIGFYNDQMKYIGCPIECTDGTMIGYDLKESGGTSDGKYAAKAIVAVVVIVLAVGGSVAAFLLIKRGKPTKQ